MITHDHQLRRLRRVRGKLRLNINLPRLSVYRSSKQIWVQLIDDKHSKTLLTSSSKSIKTKATKIEKATLVGEDIAAKALKLNIKKIRFDRGIYRYHGRVKAVAEAARSKGLQF